MSGMRVVVAAMAAVAVWAAAFVPAGAARSFSPDAHAPDFGANVIVLNPSMAQASIQAKLDAIATQQVPNQFGPQRYTIFFEPGTYGSPADPLDFQVGYYTEVAGLGAQPGDVVVNGAINAFNQCDANNVCNGTDNFWRSLSNLTLNVHLPSTPPAYAPASGESPACLNSNEMWAVSQAAPMRRVIMNGSVTLQDYCGSGFVSGGFFADDEFNPPQGQSSGVVINAGQQQFFTRNSNIDTWTNGVWNQVFMGDDGAPATSFGPKTNQYTTLPATPVSQEKPFLYTDPIGAYNVFVPAVRHNSVGPSYAGGTAAGGSIPISRFFLADPGTPVGAINTALARGRNLILEPGVYDLRHTIEVSRPHTIVMGLGFATLIPQGGKPAMRVADAPGVKLSGIIFDAGPESSPALLAVDGPRSGDPGDPTLLQDIFFRIGGAEFGQAANSLIVSAGNTILDDVWAWRADHGAGAGWTSNRADTGVVVNGDNVHAYGLAVEHYQKYEVVWNGQNGEDVFFQNEMPYDPPSQSAWMSSPATDGYAAFLVSPWVRTFQGYGMGSYSFFNQGVPIFAGQAFQSPDTPGVQFHDLLTVFLDATHGSGGINSVINGVGGPSTAADADQPVDVAGYP
ncbi:MAG TPA: coagulation factor 5/8 type domain-containing protein [Solirubrobacteraceae bacterium]|nr:coagulation factor 5/8 type domain-containing protein [Solirubrobacteraceae bacterium]